jgi:hypothetical protein
MRTMTLAMVVLMGCGGTPFTPALSAPEDDAGSEVDSAPDAPLQAPPGEAGTPQGDSGPTPDANAQDGGLEGASEASPGTDANNPPDSPACEVACQGLQCGSSQGCDCGSCPVGYDMCGDNNDVNECGQTCLNDAVAGCRTVCEANGTCPTWPIAWGVTSACTGTPYQCPSGSCTDDVDLRPGGQTGCIALGAYVCCP